MSLNLRFWLISCAAALGVGITASLGAWQLGRAADKEALQLAIEQQSAKSALLNPALLVAPDALALVHRRALLSGTWLPQNTVFLDNRQMDAKPGFFVLTPFELADQTTDNKKVIMVQRGWVARHFLDRSLLPSVPTPGGIVQIEGRIALPPSKLYAFQGADNGLIRQNIDVPEFARQIQRDFLGVTLLQTDAAVPVGVTPSPAPDGLLRHWLQPNIGVEKHYGYMAQWWALSTLIAVLYVWFQIIRPRKKSAQSPTSNATH